MKKFKGNFHPVFAALLVIGTILAFQGCAYNVGQKPILTMPDVKSLAPADLADFTISLYNKQADWYRDQMGRVATFSLEQKKQLVKDYELLTKTWPIIDLYDRLVATGQPVDDATRIEIYRFIDQYLGGGE